MINELKDDKHSVSGNDTKPIVSGRHKWVDNSGVGYEMCMKCCKRRRSVYSVGKRKRYEYERLYGWSDVPSACR